MDNNQVAKYEVVICPHCHFSNEAELWWFLGERVVDNVYGHCCDNCGRNVLAGKYIDVDEILFKASANITVIKVGQAVSAYVNGCEATGSNCMSALSKALGLYVIRELKKLKGAAA